MSRTIDLPHSAPEPVRIDAWQRLRDALARLVSGAVEEFMVSRAIKELRALDDRTLKDIGITRSEIESCARWPREKKPSYRPRER